MTWFASDQRSQEFASWVGCCQGFPSFLLILILTVLTHILISFYTDTYHHPVLIPLSYIYGEAAWRGALCYGNSI